MRCAARRSITTPTSSSTATVAASQCTSHATACGSCRRWRTSGCAMHARQCCKGSLGQTAPCAPWKAAPSSRRRFRASGATLHACRYSPCPLHVNIKTSFASRMHIADLISDGSARWHVYEAAPGHQATVIRAWVVAGAHCEPCGDHQAQTQQA